MNDYVKTDSCDSKTIIREHIKPVFYVNKQENIESLASKHFTYNQYKTCSKT